MSKFFKKFGTILVLAAMLGGCREEMPSLGEASSTETTSGTVTETSAATTAVPAKEDKETSTVTSEKSETTAEHDEISDEQAALEKLILDTAENTDGYTIQSPLFGDFDGDGINELITVYGNKDYAASEELFSGDIWFASNNNAEKICDADWDWLAPEIVTSCGDTFIKFEKLYVTGFVSEYVLIKNSNPQKIVIPSFAMDFRPDREYGDFTANYKPGEEYAHSANTVVFNRYWFYRLNGKFGEYAGREITEKEFLEYNGAQAVIDEISEKEFKLKNIIKRSNGIINVNGVTEDGWYCYRTLRYRSGKVTYIDGYNDGFYVDIVEDDYKPTDFERFSEMIYDTAEGDENSFIRERFYGDTDKDGKNELYAYYGTDENFSLWFADDSGAKKVTEDISLFYADGDVLMKNGDDYFVIKKGKQKKLDTMGAEEFSVQADGSFTGYVSAGYTDSTRSEEARKLYWFRYRDGKISEYTGTDITEEELLEYGGGRAFLDEIAARGGDLVNIVRRENGIINVNYALHNQTVTKRFFMTLEIGADNKLTDITPKKEDGTPDNAGWYLHSLKIGG